MSDQEAAVAQLKKYFPDTEKDTITKEDIFRLESRDLQNKERNSSWLRTQARKFRSLNLADSIKQAKGKVEYTIGIKLTEEGKKVLSEMKIREEKTNEDLSNNQTPFVSINHDNKRSYTIPVEPVVETMEMLGYKFSKVTADVNLKEAIVSIHMVRE